MQDPSLYSQIKAQVQPQPQFPEQEHLKCPRCDSPNTKFCYFNNYNLSQPRHFCKNCKRYWTKGGALRNIPVGGGSRKNTKRSSSASSSSSSSSAAAAASSSSANIHQSKRPTASASNNNNHNSNSNSAAAISESLPLKGERYVGHFGNLMEVSGSFSSLLGSNGVQFGNFLDGLGTNGSSLQLSEYFGGPDPSGSVSGHTLDPPIGLDRGNSNNADGFLNVQGAAAADSACWNGGNGWPDLAIHTPGTNFQ